MSGEFTEANTTLEEPLLNNEIVDDGNKNGGEDTTDGGNVIVNVDEPETVTYDESNNDRAQAARFRDAWAGILFLAHYVVLLVYAFGWGTRALHQYNDERNDDEDEDNESDDQAFDDDTVTEDGDDSDNVTRAQLIGLVVLTSICAVLFSSGVLSLMMHFSKQFIEISLLSSVIVSLLGAMIMGLVEMWLGLGFFLLAALMSGLYAWFVWKRIPFAAANLMTALTAIQANRGLLFVGYAMTLIMNVNAIIWALAWFGVYFCNSTNEDGECIGEKNFGFVILFLISFYWIAQVSRNVLRCTVSGVVGTFWFSPDQADAFCSTAIYDSWWRASTYSFGSICLGSLLTAILEALHSIAKGARNQSPGSLVLCVAECILRCLERVVEYFNKWAYIYIGLYGYSYLTAGKKVAQLFKQRGWTAIINDDLVSGALFLVNLIVGGLTGLMGVLFAIATTDASPEQLMISFVMPFLLGLALSNVCLGVVSSGVDTVVVAFAEAPLDLERNHPYLHTQMTLAWEKVYPEEFSSNAA